MTGQFDVPGSVARRHYYNANGWPTVWFDGESFIRGGGNYYQRFLAKINEASKQLVPLSVKVDAQLNSREQRAQIDVTVNLAENVEFPEECVIRMVIVEDGLTYRNRNFDRTVREVLSDESLTVSAAGESQIVSKSFPVLEGWDPTNLSVVAWVQRESDDPGRNRYVINAAQGDIEPLLPVIQSSWGEIKLLFDPKSETFLR